MTEKIGPYDFTKLHVVQRNGEVELYERRLRFILTNSTGRPRRVLPDGLSWQHREREKVREDDRIVRAWVMVPVHIVE